MSKSIVTLAAVLPGAYAFAVQPTPRLALELEDYASMRRRRPVLSR